MKSDRPRGPWHWATVAQAPHRLAFLAGMVMLAMSALWWWAEMVARAAGSLGWAQAVPPSVAHALWMTLGFVPMFFCGFLFTAGPKWLQVGEVPVSALRLPVAVMVIGWGAYALGVHADARLAAVGLLGVALGWSALLARFVGLIRLSRAADTLHARLIAAASVAGAGLMLVMAITVWRQDWAFTRLASLLALWLWLVPVYVTVAHRMIPFFTAAAVPVLDAWRPNWLLWTLLGLVGLQAVWLLADALSLASPGLTGAHALASVALGALVLGLAVRWGVVQSLRIRMLAMLHVGFVWLGVAACLDAIVTVAGWMGEPWSSLLPLHALTMGFLGSVLLAMVTRVSCGHGGRTLVADDALWALFWSLQVAVVERLVAAAWPATGSTGLMVAASLWLGVMGAWAVRLSRWYGRPRLDGRPG